MSNTISHIFHVDISQKIPNEDYWLYVGGRKYKFKEHTDETIARAKAASPSLKDVPANKLTHFTEEVVEMPANKVVLISVRYSTRNTPKVPNHYGIHQLKMSIPPPSAIIDEIYNQGKGAGTVPAGTPSDGDNIRGLSSLENFENYYFTHGYIDYVSTAQAILTHHPDLFVFDIDTANVVSEHFTEGFSETNYQGLQNLANYIASKPMPTTVKGEGWAYWKPFDTRDAISEGLIDPPPNGYDSYYMLSFDSGFNSAAGPGLSSVLNSTKNDLRLQGKKWMYQKGLSVKDISSSGGAQNKEANSFEPLGSAKMETSEDGQSGGQVELANDHKSDGLISSVELVDLSEMKVELTMTNSYLRWLAVYVQFIDAAGDSIDLNDTWRSEDVSKEVNNAFNVMHLQYSDMRYLGNIAPVSTLEGVPTTSSSNTFTFKFPENAVQAKFYGCGLGNGNTDYPQVAILGGGYTAFSNLAIPGIFLISTAAALSYKPLNDWLDKNSTKITIGRLLLDNFNSLISGDSFYEAYWEDIEDIAKILFDKAALWALGWVTAQLGEAAVEDAIPGVGWIVAANNILVDTALITQTSTEVATSPIMIENKVSIVMDSTIVVKPDPRHQAFPQQSPGDISRCELKIYRKGDAVACTMGKEIDGNTPTEIDFIFSNQLGGQIKFEINYYTGSFMAAQAATGWLDNHEDTVTEVTMYLVEIPVPLKADSVYNHSAILTYSDNAYQWSESGNAPVSVRTDSSTDPNGNGISKWNALSLSQRYAMIAPSYKAAGLGVLPADSAYVTGYNNQLYAFQNFDIPGTPMNNVQFPSEGFIGQSKLVYDVFPPKFKMITEDGNLEWALDANGNPEPDPDSIDLGGYYIDPRKADNDLTADGGYHLRKVVLNAPVPPYNMSANQNSWGRFPYYPDSVTMHPLGYVIGINQEYHRLMILQLPSQSQMNTGTADSQSNMARVLAGPAQNLQGNGGRPGLLFLHSGLTCTYDGTIIVLEQVASAGFSMARLQAFDIKGNPVYVFDAPAGSDPSDSDSVENGKSPFYYLPNDDVTYLDVVAVGDSKCTYIYVLSYEGSGNDPSDYKVAIYQCTGSDSTDGNTTGDPKDDLLLEQSGISAAKINVDMWHTLYTLNYEMTKSGIQSNSPTAGPTTTGNEGPNGRTVPSVSEWIIPSPE